MKKFKQPFLLVLVIVMIVAIVTPSIIKAWQVQVLKIQPTSHTISANAVENIDSADKQSTKTELAHNAKAALLMDYNTGTVVFEKNPDTRYPIASMVKIMTLGCIFDAINNGELTLNSDIQVSPNASGMGGSQAFLDANATYKAGELIKSIVVASANDSCVALAEHIAGSVEGFVELMNNKATQLGMNNTRFENCTGLPSDNAYSCAIDVSIMMRNLLKNDKFYEYAKVWMYDIVHPSGRTTALSNTNKLIRGYNGCDGGKTGFTNEAMYCLSATAKRGNTRLIAITMGEKDSKVRNYETSGLLNYGFGNYETVQLIDQTKQLEQKASVSKGKLETVAIAPKNDYFVFNKKGNKDKYTFNVLLNKVNAPIKSGDNVGVMSINKNGEKIEQINLIAMQDIQESSYFDLLDRVVKQW